MTAAEKASRLSTTLAQYVVTSAHRKVRQHSDHLIGEFLVSATGDQCLLSVTDARVVRASITRSCSVARVTRRLHGGATSWLWARGTGRLGAQASRGRGHSCTGGTDRLHACKTSHSHTQGTDCVRARGSRGESHLHAEEARHLHGWQCIASQ